MNGERDFRPQLSGVVAKDFLLAGELSRIFAGLLSSSALCMRESVECAGDRERGDALARAAHDALEEARLLGELALALGVRRRRRSRRDPLDACAFARRARIEAYESLMGQTGDRVVRSVLSRLIMMARRAPQRGDAQ